MTQFRFADTIQLHCSQLAPRKTDTQAKLQELAGIRAVLFDIYGTLLISASGDIGANAGDHRLDALLSTVELFGLKLKDSSAVALDIFQNEIKQAHLSAKAQAVEYPEVDIVAIWRKALPQCVEGDLNGVDFEQFAFEYEIRVNPVWPMPKVESTLANLTDRQLVLGIVSNAQFFTPLLFPVLLGKTLDSLGFVPELSYFSYEHSQAKPGHYLYQLAQQQLESCEIQPAEVLYVGNDMLNDIAAAAAVGFKTALFAGDQRSLRLRTDDERTQGVVPDVIVTELPQLLDCLAN